MVSLQSCPLVAAIQPSLGLSCHIHQYGQSPSQQRDTTGYDCSTNTCHKPSGIEGPLTVTPWSANSPLRAIDEQFDLAYPHEVPQEAISLNGEGIEFDFHVELSPKANAMGRIEYMILYQIKHSLLSNSCQLETIPKMEEWWG
ncbi:hypothetical protein [Paludibacterium denitrificans]|uniref:Uncharacterized protein n=1 Tax=Paludibacterium denitrificans TaxID=2675226 RepID=A0A844GEW3_9NEIS|nr:hypothetical protein [Paludibacterium denitrificans]MTD33437.1 hypothetical protein [Paludibacterium denitrificans]